MATRKWKISKLILAFATACLLTITSAPVLSQNVEQLYQQGVVTYGKGNFSEAESIFRQVIKIAPNKANAYIALGLVLDNQGKLEEAITNYEKAIQINPNDAIVHYNLGNALYKQGKLEEAIANHEKAIQLKPDYTNAYYNLGNALYKQRKLEEAITNYEKAIELNPNYAKAYMNRGIAQEEQGKLEEAITNYQQAIELNPNDAIVHYNLGNALYKQGELEEAITNYEKAIELNPNYAKAYNNLGYALEKQDKLEEAIKQYQRSLEIDPEFVTAKNNLREAERLLAIKLNPPLPDIDDIEYLPSATDEPLANTLRSTARIIAEVSADGISIGAGWVVKKEANIVWIVTNHHVISDRKTHILSKKIEVEFFSELPDTKRPRYPATIINSTDVDDDEELDLAVLLVTGIPDDIQELEVRLGRVQRDANVRVIGHPYTLLYNPWIVSRGVILNYDPDSPKIAMSVFFAQGNSGGPVINSNNQVIGMMVGIRSNVDVAVNPNQPTPNIDVTQPATGGVGLAYRIDIVIAKLREWGVID